MSLPLPLKARRCVDAAEGWLELGDWKSASEELAQLDPNHNTHPEVLRMCVEIHTAAKRWDLVIESADRLSRLMPDQSYACLRLAYALHELKRTQAAWTTLLRVADTFPDQWVIPYNLACYAAQLGDLPGAREWLAKSFKVGDEVALRREALEDPDLAPLWQHGGV